MGVPLCLATSWMPAELHNLFAELLERGLQNAFFFFTWAAPPPFLQSAICGYSHQKLHT